MIAADDFFRGFLETALAPDEMITEVRVPKTGGAGWAFEKFNRRAQDWAIVGVAAVGGDAPGVALVNMGSTPVRAAAVEAALRGGASAADAAALAADGTDPPSDLNASPEYRRHLARVLVGRALDTVATSRRRPMTTTFGAGSLVGVPVRRVEDPTLLRGEGTYIDNLDLDGVLHLAFVRSPMAHAEITGDRHVEARAMPGVVAVYTADRPRLPRLRRHDAAAPRRSIRPPLARGPGALRRRHRRGGGRRDARRRRSTPPRP